MPLTLLLLVFIALPIAELYIILQVGDAIGAVPTILILAADSVLGSVLLRSQGRAVWRRFNETMARGQLPRRELQDGVAVIFGGAFLITPGFLTDVVGLLLLLPPTREALRRMALRKLEKRMSAPPPAGGRDATFVDGTATEHERPEAPRRPGIGP